MHMFSSISVKSFFFFFFSLNQPVGYFVLVLLNWKLTSYLFFVFLWDLSWLFFLWCLLSSSEPEWRHEHKMIQTLCKGKSTICIILKAKIILADTWQLAMHYLHNLSLKKQNWGTQQIGLTKTVQRTDCIITQIENKPDMLILKYIPDKCSQLSISNCCPAIYLNHKVNCFPKSPTYQTLRLEGTCWWPNN